MSVICPTVLAKDPHEFREQMEKIIGLGERIQIDLTDGSMTPNSTIELGRIWWPEEGTVDIHLMYKNPIQYLAQLINMKPNMVIIHAEAEVNHMHFADELRRFGIKSGVAILEDTQVQDVAEILPHFDHLLIFSGDLGSFGGQVDLNLLSKVEEARKVNPKIEIGWDGGANKSNVTDLSRGGVDIINVGGAIQKTEDPNSSYEELVALAMV